ncbi:MAG: 1-deoxy-D-xylulose-5-phosphate synthase [Flavobacteriaceae bacterium]
MQKAILPLINSPAQLRTLGLEALTQLADELRAEIIQVVSAQEGHLGASLGVVELTIALHYVFNTPQDILVWDVGHQAYGHKMLTGRRKEFTHLRQWKGLSGFPKRGESAYDPFGTGHSSTAISAVLGMALANQTAAETRQHIAVVGDASIASGMAFEALNHLGTTQANVLIILNDNAMGIDPSVGALKQFFEEVSQQQDQKENIFTHLNIAYSGPIDGHDLIALIDSLKRLKKATGPRILHIRTTKGKGLASAEEDQVRFHAPGKFDPLTGKLNKNPQKGKTKYQTIVGKTLNTLFQENSRLMAITPAMPTGSGLTSLMEQFPERCIDVGIAEQHAVTLAAGMATQGLLPICVIYSTFLQRAYDQIIHDVALQNLPVIFCIDRAGLVGHDGPTHHGVFDIAFLRTLPHMTLLAPRDEVQLRNTLFSLTQTPLDGPVAIRYPRGYGTIADWEQAFETINVLKGSCLKPGKRIALISIGTTSSEVEKALAQIPDATEVAHYDLGPIKPLDEALLKNIFTHYDKVITVEDSALAGGAGSAILEWASDHQYTTTTKRIGLVDVFVPQGAPVVLKEKFGLEAKHIAATIMDLLKQ